MVRVYALPAEESWICDDLADDWKNYSGIAADTAEEADVCWLLSDWRWRSVPMEVLKSKPVVTQIHHIVPEKFDEAARLDFTARDEITDEYLVYNRRAYDDLRTRTNKPITLIPYWANGDRWKRSELTMRELRHKHGIPQDAYVLMSAQRDTEGSDLTSPKLEKGADLLANAFEQYYERFKDVHVLLGGWRRQYVIGRLEAAGIPYTYFERPPQPMLAELYQAADLYLVCSRCEGGPQSLLECGLLGVPTVSRPVGIAEQVLPTYSLDDEVVFATPCIPNVERMKLPHGMDPYREFMEKVHQNGKR